jgi:hypothetical protein
MNPIKQTTAAALVLADWLGDGGEPVERALAQSRANHCLKCPRHHGGLWWETVKDPIAIAIKAALSLKNGMKISVKNEGALAMCLVCGCAMRLKVHVPAQHFKETITEEQMKEFEQVGCWIPQEIKTP